MRTPSVLGCIALLASQAFTANCIAQTDGAATFRATLNTYSSSTRHWTVVWVTTSSGTFIKSLRKQGPSWTTSHWGSHCAAWQNARNGNQALDGYSSATAQNYTGTNSPVVITWDGRDSNGQLMPDGTYKFWLQYAEDAGQGPYTTNGLSWTKGPANANATYPNVGSRITGVSVAWSTIEPPPAPPHIGNLFTEGGNLVLIGTGQMNRQFVVLGSSNLAAPVAQWNPLSTNLIDSSGAFGITNSIDAQAPQFFFRLQMK